MQTGIVIVNYNDYESTYMLVENIKKYKIIEKIVIVDNNSNEEEKEKLRTIKGRKIKIIENSENKGYSYAINIGAKYLISLYGKCNIIVSNSDIIIKDEKHIKELLKTLLDKNVAVSAPVIFENGKLNRGWKITTVKQDILMMMPKIYKFFQRKFLYYKEEHYIDKISVVDVVSGCFFFIKSTVLEEIGFLDENVFLYYEENILASKLKELGLVTRINNEVVIIHNHSVTIDKNINRKRKLKVLRDSQYYYEGKYNGASRCELFVMKMLSKLFLLFVK